MREGFSSNLFPLFLSTHGLINRSPPLLPLFLFAREKINRLPYCCGKRISRECTRFDTKGLTGERDNKTEPCLLAMKPRQASTAEGKGGAKKKLLLLRWSSSCAATGEVTRPTSMLRDRLASRIHETSTHTYIHTHTRYLILAGGQTGVQHT